MMKLLILYPEEFKAYSKFERKLSNILKSVSQLQVMFEHDSNGFISRFFDGKSEAKLEKTKFNESEYTHAIVFSDGEEFVEEVENLSQQGVKLRRIKIKITRVVNIKTDANYNGRHSTASYEYIGRGSYWGNPYAMPYDGDREEVIRKFKYDFDYDKLLNREKSQCYSLAGKRLGCFCKPESCHGDVIADFLNSWDDGE
ncbi:DUF4326 domain-containing protein [Vibrio campbellii]|uniref:DUF4326 domain-containing protein n=1 Tax=Vibrio campbellii TaxID=680 RepID=UPI0038CD14A4